MKVNVEMEMSPEEARRLMGLPDVAPLQASLMAEMEKRMRVALDGSDPEAMVKAWMAPGMQGLEAFNRLLWDAARGVAGKTDAAEDKHPR